MQGWYSPLHLACKFGHEQVIWLLLESGATWSLTDKVLLTYCMYLSGRHHAVCCQRRRKRRRSSGPCGMAKPLSRIEWIRLSRWVELSRSMSAGADVPAPSCSNCTHALKRSPWRSSRMSCNKPRSPSRSHRYAEPTMRILKTDDFLFCWCSTLLINNNLRYLSVRALSSSCSLFFVSVLI